MPRLIDANALIRDIDNYYHNSPFPHPGTTWLRGLELAVGLMLKAPTVDAVEVKHGRWEKAEYNGFLRCDQCKDVYINEEWLEDGKWNYCPNCGAKMDMEVEE